MLVIRTSLVAVVLLFTCAGSACSQSTTQRLVPSQSGKELVRDDSSNADGIVQITFGQIFKPGAAEFAQIRPQELKGIPPFPTGFASFRDQIYRVSTEAVVSGEHAIVFALPTVKDRAEFDRLEVHHLQEDELSPAGKSWMPVTVSPGGWNDDAFQFITKSAYEKLRPDFSSRRIAAITNEFGVFAVALGPELQNNRPAPFTKMELTTSSVPEKVDQLGHVTHTLIIRNNGPVTAQEVNVKEELGNHLDFESATATQGACSQSLKSSGRVICHLGSIPAGGNISVKIIARVQQNATLMDGANEVANVVELVFKEKPTDFVDANNQLFTRFNTVISKNP